MKRKHCTDCVQRTSRFSLIEIMIVVVIIGMIVGLVGPNFMKNFGQAKREAAKSQVMLLGNAVKDYYLDMSEYPPRLSALIDNPGNERWDGPYLDPPKLPIDPWNEPYQYRYPGEHGKYDIMSYGADKSPGGDGENADITSWE